MREGESARYREKGQDKATDKRIKHTHLHIYIASYCYCYHALPTHTYCHHNQCHSPAYHCHPPLIPPAPVTPHSNPLPLSCHTQISYPCHAPVKSPTPVTPQSNLLPLSRPTHLIRFCLKKHTGGNCLATIDLYSLHVA